MIKGKNYTVHIGNNLDILPTLESNSIDSIVTDPPYELGFMGKKWDSSGIAYNVELWRECLRVLKPGGHMLAFGGTRTWHRIAVAIEDAGFEVRDSIAWMYGSGFPKSLDISKAIDKAAGAEREVTGHVIAGIASGSGNAVGGAKPLVEKKEIPITPEAKQWEGWGTALKPAFEPVIVARKPLIGTVAENVLTYGTGGLNIDGSRIGTTDNLNGGRYSDGKDETDSVAFSAGINKRSKNDFAQPSGRWPSNVILDPYTAELLDEQSGIRPGGTYPAKRGQSVNTSFASGQETAGGQRSMGDTGGASRFFYVAKASKRDRNEGLDNIEGKEIGAKGNGLARTCATCGASILNPCECPDRTFVNPTRQNFHPTVKPTTLMEYLIKLVTPPNGLVLDPFTGSGSTGKAALLNGFRFVGCELTEDYIPIIEGRLNHAEAMAEQAKEKEDEALF